MLGNLDTAIYLLSLAIDEKPNSGATNYALADIYFSNKDYVLATMYSEKSVELEPQNLWYLRLLSSCYYNTYSIDQATNIYLKIIEQSDQYSDFVEAAEFFNNTSDYENEILVIESATQKFGNSFELTKRKINILFLQGSVDEVVDECNQLVTQYNYEPDAYIVSAEYLFDLQLFDNCYSVLTEGFSKFPQNGLSYFLSKYFVVTDNTDSALFYLDNSFINDDYSSQLYIDFFINYRNFFSYKKLSSELDSVLDNFYSVFFNDFSSTVYLANFYFVNNKFYKSIALYERALNQNISDFDIYASLFNMYSRFGMYEKLDSLSTFASELFPAQPLIYLFKGIASIKLNNLDDAYESLIFGKSLVFDQNDLIAYFDFYLSQYFRLQKDQSNENLYFNSALASASQNCDLLAYFAYYFANNGLYKDKSFNLIGECILSDIESLNPYIAYIYSFILFKFGDFDSALTYINIAISNSNAENFVYFELLGNIHLKLGNLDLANDAWLKSVNLGNIFLNKQL
ncbi:MAG: hypothetical protein JXL97_13125 [Bacteroidales bacterium]|nr:hypothetical protein [Bacteroidales bacterium]